MGHILGYDALIHTLILSQLKGELQNHFYPTSQEGTFLHKKISSFQV